MLRREGGGLWADNEGKGKDRLRSDRSVYAVGFSDIYQILLKSSC